MGKSYSPGLTVTDNIVLKKERILPLEGEVTVKKGDKVKANDVIAVTRLPGKVIPLNMANKLGSTPQLVGQFIKVKQGDEIKKDQILAETKGFFGFFKQTVKSPTDGEVENISKHTGQMLLREPRIPIEVKAFIDGIVVEVIPKQGCVIENVSAYIQGIFGIGDETIGDIEVTINDCNDPLTLEMIKPEHKDKILVSGTVVSYEAIQKAISTGVKAIITGGIDDHDLKKLLGYDIGVAITGHENIGITIVVTEGFGPIKMARKTFSLLKQFQGHQASVHGRTQIRAGVIRPEIIIPIEFDENALTDVQPSLPFLEIGATIRVIREPNFGFIGKVTGLPEQLKVVESETKVRILEAELENGQKVTIPRANVEIIEDH
ncbi:MAG: hypothetical protein K8S56_05965 [Candidatus Cloacimonetes bacterium]|nr:hypothetical protein [Candidatus Cloacimonadota bacterium]